MKRRLGGLAVVALALAAIGAGSITLAGELTGGQERDPRSLGQDPPAYQQAILEDGHVTDAEMQAAVDATVVCMVEKGFDASVPAGYPGPGVNRNILVVTEDDSSPKAALTECKNQFMNQVEWRYATERDTRTPVSGDTMFALFDECMASKGFPAADQKADPEAYWSSEQLNETAAQLGGTEAIDGCFDELSHLKAQ